nr:reverse transcriptase domain-containing protein [Tanacetum cinerariifolium]
CKRIEPITSVGNKITSTIKYKDVPNLEIKLMFFPLSLVGAARRWLKKEPLRSILTWEDLISKFINEFFPPSRTTNLRNEISNFQQRFDESFHEAWDRYKDLIRACPHHGFTELHQLDTFYNALNPADQDSLEFCRRWQSFRKTYSRCVDDYRKQIQAKHTHVVNQQTNAVTTAMTALLKQFQATPPPASVKAVEEICVTCSGAHLGLVLDGPSVPMPHPFINPEEDERAEETLTDPKLTEYTIKVPPPLILKALLSNKDKLSELENTPLNENYSAIIIKKLPEKLGDPRKFLIPCGFSELKCKNLADPGITRDVFVLTARALIDVRREEMILRDGDERLTLNMRHDTLSYSNQPHKESINMINIYNDSCKDYLEDLFPTNHLSGNPTFSSHTDLTSLEVINPLSGSTTSTSPDHFLKEFVDELTLITFPQGIDDLTFDIESDLRKIEYLLNHYPTKEMDSILEDSVDECNLADPNKDLVDTIPERFTDEHTPDYSSPPLYDDIDDYLVELESDNDDVYDDPFDSKEDKIKESKLLIDELDPPRSSDFLPSPKYDSVLYEDFSGVDVLPSTNNEDKDFDPPLYKLPFLKEVPGSKTLLSFSSKNEEKVFNLGILTSKGLHTSLFLELSHRGSKAFKAIKIFESPMEIFPCSYGEDIRILDVPCLHLYPP